MNRTLVFGIGLIGMALAAQPAIAVEAGTFGGPIGGTDIRQAYLPPVSGLYGAAVFLATHAPQYNDQSGNYSLTRSPAYFTAFAEGGGLLYIYPINPLGFTIGSSIQFSTSQIDQSLTISPTLRLQQRSSGLADSYTDFFYASKYLGLFGAQPGGREKLKYGLTFAFGLGAELPIGRYDVRNLANNGYNTFILIPNFAFTYLTGPNLSIADGTEISARFFYEAPQRNPASLYKSGDIVDLDSAVTERWKNFQFGGAFTYSHQANNDLNGAGAIVAPNGNIYQKIFAGPVFAYDDPNTNMTYKFRASFPIHDANTYENRTFVFSIARKLL